MKATIRAKYTYGKPVKGEATISVYPSFAFGSLQPFAQNLISRKTVPLDGKATVEFDTKTDLSLTDDYSKEFVIEAIVEEELTGKIQRSGLLIQQAEALSISSSGRKQNGSTKVTINKVRYTLDIIKDANNFKPGLPFNAFVKVANRDGTPVRDKTNKVKVEYSFDWSDKRKEVKEYLLDDNGMSKIAIDMPADSETLRLTVGINNGNHLSRISDEFVFFFRQIIWKVRPTIQLVKPDLKATHL